MTLTQFQAIVHSLYAGDAETPDSSSKEWTVRLNYLKAAINSWDTEVGMLWNELFTTLEAAATGDKTATSSTLVYDAPDDFRFLGGYVVSVGSDDQRTRWGVYAPEKANVLEGTGIIGIDDGNVFVTGNPKTGYKINFSSQPTVGDTIDYAYYKTAFEPSTGSDILEMSDPYFAVYFTLSKLHEQDGQGDRATFAMSQAESKLAAMKTLNAMLPNYQANNLENPTILRTGAGFGL
jgi:hypothetical protein